MEILECDDVAVYVEAVVLMYSAELKSKLLGMEVSKILALLKVYPHNSSSFSLSLSFMNTSIFFDLFAMLI